MAAINKTNAMRALDSLGVACESASYPGGKTPPGALEAAELLGANPNAVYKTLVAKTSTGEIGVFVVPALASLSLKKAAAALGKRSLSLIDPKDLVKTTGYQKGGCSPIAMKKQYPTFIEESALALERIYVNAGRVGLMLKLAPRGLAKAAGAAFADIVQD